MAKDPLLPAKPGEGDSWESLASNLLGIDLKKSIDVETVSPEELEALELDVFDEPEEAAPPELEPAGAVSGESTAPVETAAAPSEAEPDSAADPYWDPLAAWEWDDEPSKRSRAPQPSVERPPLETVQPAAAAAGEDSVVKSPGADARRAADSFDTVTDYREEYESDDWEFGAGLLEGVAPPEPKKTSPPPPEAAKWTEPAPPAKHPGEDRPAERRDRSRPQSRDERPPSREVERKSVESRPRREPAAPPPPARPPAARAAAEDDFGAGLVEDDFATTEGAPAEVSGDEEREPRRPRRRSRRRGRPSTGDARTEPRGDDGDHPRDASRPVASPETVPDEYADEPEADEDAHAESPYHNIPSWEEAISYLTNPRRAAESAGESRSPERQESASRSESSGSGRSSGGGGRRRRRRPPK